MNNELTIVLRAKDLASRTLRVVGGTINTFAKTATGSFGLLQRQLLSLRGLLAAGIFAGLVSSFAEFERGVISIRTLSDDARLSYSRLSEDIKQVALETGQSLSSLTNAGFEAVSARGVEGFELLTQASKLATAGVTDIDTAIRGLASVLNNYGLAARDAAFASDLLVTTANVGRLNIEGLAQNFEKVLPAARGAKISLEEVAAAFATVSQAASPEETATSLRNFIQVLTVATPEARKFGQQLGITFGEEGIKAAGGILGLTQRVAQLNLNSEQLTRLFSGSQEALSAIRPLLADNGRLVRQYYEAIRNGAGSTEKAFSQFQQTLAFQLDRLGAAFKVTAVEIGESLKPALIEAIDRLQAFVRFVRNNREIIGEFGRAFIVGVTNFVEAGGKKLLELGDLVLKTFEDGQFFAFITQAAITAIRTLGRLFIEAVPFFVRVAATLGQGFGSALAEAILGSTTAEILTNVGTNPIITSLLKLIGFDEIEQLQQRAGVFTTVLSTVQGDIESFNQALSGSTQGINPNRFLVSAGESLSRLSDRIAEDAQRLPETERELRQNLLSFALTLDVGGRSVARAAQDSLARAEFDVTPEVRALVDRVIADIEKQAGANAPRVARALNLLVAGTSAARPFAGVADRAAKDLTRELGGFSSKAGAILREEADRFAANAPQGLRSALERVLDFSDLAQAAERTAGAFGRATGKLREALRVQEFVVGLGQLRDRVFQAFPAVRTLSEQLSGNFASGLRLVRELAGQAAEAIGRLTNSTKQGGEVEIQFDVASIADVQARIRALREEASLLKIADPVLREVDRINAAYDESGREFLALVNENKISAELAGEALFALEDARIAAVEDATRESIKRLNEFQQAVEQVGPALANGFTDLFANIISGSQSAGEAIRNFVTQSLSQLSRLFLNAAFTSIGRSVFPGIFPETAANGAVWRGGFQAFANGTPVVDRPTLGLVGEGRYNEAIIPLPDGRRVPVDLRGGGGEGSSNSFTFNLNVQALDGESAARVLIGQAGTIKAIFQRAVTTDPSFRGSLRMATAGPGGR